MYILIMAAVMAASSLLLAWWTEADAHDDSFDLAMVLARPREPKDAGRSLTRMARAWDWWWGNSKS